MSAGASSLTASVLGKRPRYEERARSNFPADDIQRRNRLARDILIHFQTDEDSEIRMRIIEEYAKIGDITWAYTNLKNHWCERSRVAKICGTIGDSKLARPILEALKNDKDAYVKLSVAKAFLKIGDRGEALNIFQGLKNYKATNARIRTKIANAFLEFNLFDSVNK